jgi:hypothetical protein
MSIIIHPRQAPNRSQPTKPTRGGKGWLWTGLIVVMLFGLAVGLIKALAPQVHDTAEGTTMTPHGLAVTASEPTVALVADAAEAASAALPHHGNAQEAPERELASPPPISFEQREHMQREMRQNEALPPEERRPLAPTPDMMRALDEERGVPQ